ncbi:MAG TPA: XrtA/PEP-CTERM system histidine kinase PrsK [Burkholderiaceae bacterium]|nr:XrtA/PEP-CTERM system histidine kinase PrsK [Burkholderiaceae bacterium]
MSLAAYSHAFALLAYGALALSLLRDRAAGRGLSQRLFFGAILASAAWGAASLGAHLVGRGELVLAAGALDLTRYAAWFVFAMALLRPLWPHHRLRTRLMLGVLTLAVVTVGVSIAFAVAGGAAAPQALVRYLPLASLSLPVLGLVLVEQVFRGASEDARWHTKPLCLGLAVIFAYDVYLHSHVLLFGRFDADSLTVRGAAHALAAGLLYVATKRSTEWSKPFELSRNAAFHTATLMLVGAYLLLLSGIGYYVRNLGGDWGGALELALICIGLVVLATLVVSGSLRAKLRVFVGKNFFRYRYDYRVEWLRFTSRLASADSPQEVGGLVARALAEMMHSPSSALWYRDADAKRLVQAARWNAARSGQTEDRDSPFMRFIGEREWVVDLDEYRAHPERFDELKVPAWMAEQTQYWLVLPLVVGEALEGFVIIDRPHAAVQLNWEVRDLLKTAARQAAGYLALMHSTDALLEARKFEAFNRMSAFVVHDLKNIVAQLSLMMQNAKRLRHNPAFQDDMLTTVDNSLEKMRRLMLQLRSGETPLQATAGVALPALVERIGAAVAARGRAIEVQVVDQVVTRGHEDRVERVLGHIVDNALDATQANAGTVTLALAREGSHAKITVRDTGEGMSADFVRSRLFKPFQSTKANGMGIGTYESRQYIQEIGGSLAVDSEPGRGTVITVLLPLLETGRPKESELYTPS